MSGDKGAAGSSKSFIRNLWLSAISWLFADNWLFCSPDKLSMYDRIGSDLVEWMIWPVLYFLGTLDIWFWKGEPRITWHLPCWMRKSKRSSRSSSMFSVAAREGKDDTGALGANKVWTWNSFRKDPVSNAWRDTLKFPKEYKMQASCKNSK